MIKYHFQEHLLCGCNNQFCLISLGIVISKSFRREWDKLLYWFFVFHLCTHAPTHPCTHATMQQCTHSHMHPIHQCNHAPVYPFTHAFMHPCTHVSLYPCNYAPMHPYPANQSFTKSRYFCHLLHPDLSNKFKQIGS